MIFTPTFEKLILKTWDFISAPELSFFYLLTPTSHSKCALYFYETIFDA
jgi:hypothetical protein